MESEEEVGPNWLAAFVAIVFALAVGAAFYAMSGVDDDASRNVQSFLNTAKAGEPLGVYNSLHPSVQERISFDRCRQLMQQHRALFEQAQVTHARPSAEREGYYDVAAEYTAAGTKHRVLVRQRVFSGMRQITDGEAQSLRSEQNLPLITDIQLDGQSILTPQ
jgi:hypothetical protein